MSVLAFKLLSFVNVNFIPPYSVRVPSNKQFNSFKYIHLNDKFNSAEHQSRNFAKFTQIKQDATLENPITLLLQEQCPTVNRIYSMCVQYSKD